MTNLLTDRLQLRRWREEDLAPFRLLNADPHVMDFMPAPLSAAESDGMVERIENHFQRHGFGPFAVELRSDRQFLGFIGLSIPGFEAPFMPAVEIGWRLRAESWGKGLATEGARAAIRFGFEQLGLESIVSFTVPANLRSRRVMEKLGMRHSAGEDFQHPSLPEDHPFRPHVLYRLTSAESSPRNPGPVSNERL